MSLVLSQFARRGRAGLMSHPGCVRLCRAGGTVPGASGVPRARPCSVPALGPVLIFLLLLESLLLIDHLSKNLDKKCCLAVGSCWKCSSSAIRWFVRCFFLNFKIEITSSYVTWHQE